VHRILFTLLGILWASAGALAGSSVYPGIPYVAPGTNNNVLTSNGSIWVSGAPVASGTVGNCATADALPHDGTERRPELLGGHDLPVWRASRAFRNRRLCELQFRDVELVFARRLPTEGSLRSAGVHGRVRIRKHLSDRFVVSIRDLPPRQQLLFGPAGVHQQRRLPFRVLCRRRLHGPLSGRLRGGRPGRIRSNLRRYRTDLHGFGRLEGSREPLRGRPVLHGPRPTDLLPDIHGRLNLSRACRGRTSPAMPACIDPTPSSFNSIRPGGRIG